MNSSFRNLAEVEAERTRTGKLYREFLREPAMSAGVYVLPAGGTDPQKPHHEDELYYVIRGRARMRVGPKVPTGGDQAAANPAVEEQAVTEGSVIFVAAGVGHQFYAIAEELVVLVVFSPPES